MFLSLYLNRFVNSLVYYGVILSSPNLGGNFYLNYTITSAVELPAYVLGIWTMGRYVNHCSLPDFIPGESGY